MDYVLFPTLAPVSANLPEGASLPVALGSLPVQARRRPVAGT